MTQNGFEKLKLSKTIKLTQIEARTWFRRICNCLWLQKLKDTKIKQIRMIKTQRNMGEMCLDDIKLKRQNIIKGKM